MDKKKVGVTAAAVGVAAAVLLTGTYAWQSLNQEALNEASGVVNPGGRLHDDFNGTNKDVYVENFGEQQIFARIKVSEYLEIGTDAGKNLTSTESRNVTLITSDADYNNRDTWTIRDMTSDWNSTDEYWTVSVGGQTMYMPTFNKNKDSLEADINGTYDPNGDGNLDDRYSDYVDYSLTENATKSDVEVYDADLDDIDQYKEGTGVLDVNYTLSEELEHTATLTNNTINPGSYNKPIISYWDWESLEEEQKVGAYWVQIGAWVYWAQPIEPGETTGLLIDGIKQKQTFDDSWYYAIDVVGQFITADDHGFFDGTGFSTEDNYDEVTNFLNAIGVDIPVNDTEYTLATTNGDGLTWAATNTLTVNNLGDAEIKSIKLLTTTLHDESSFDEETFEVVISPYEETTAYYFDVELTNGTKFTQALKMEHPYVWADEYEMDSETGLIAVDEEGNKIESLTSWDIEAGKSLILELPDTIGDAKYEWNKDVTWYVEDESEVSEYYEVVEHPSIEGAWILTHLDHEGCDHTGESFRIWYYWNDNPKVKGDRGFHLMYPGYVEENYE